MRTCCSNIFFIADVSELACAYASLILHDDGHKVTSDKLSKVLKASGIEVESYWPSLFESTLERGNLDDLILSIGSGGIYFIVYSIWIHSSLFFVLAAAAPVETQVGGTVTTQTEKVEEKKEEPVEEEDDGMGISLFGDDDY